jgi:hypothetical protein
MRFGIVLPSYIDNPIRKKWAEASVETLLKTKTEGLDSPPFLFTITKGGESYNLFSGRNFRRFQSKSVEQLSEIRSNDGCLVWAWDQLERMNWISHLTMITDDWLYNPNWLLELQALVKRKPGAKAWWVYRSTYEEIHRTIREEPDAVLVRSINAGGCITVEEKRAWGLDWRKCPREGVNSGLSLDLLHPQQRPGDRWVTPKSYILNIGVRGACQRIETPDFARDFVGGIE